MTNQAVLIAGPTASGKSALALALAREVGGIVINADSMQVYRDLRVLTARPTQREENLVPHRLYGHIDGSASYSSGRYIEDAQAAVRTAEAAGYVPIFVGGTGLYFRALTEGLSPIPPADPMIRAKWRAAATDGPTHRLYDDLADRDPLMAARLAPTDTQRIVRALEVLETTGQSLAAWQQVPGVPVLAKDRWVGFAASWPRDKLYARADARFGAMMAGGAVDEVRQLVQRRLSNDAMVMRALGVRPIQNFIEGRMSHDAAVAAGQRQTRQYIKRQLTWLKRNMKTWNNVHFDENSCFVAIKERFVRDAVDALQQSDVPASQR